MKFGDYDVMTSNQRIVRGVLGRTDSDKALTLSTEYLKSAVFSGVKDTTENTA